MNYSHRSPVALKSQIYEHLKTVICHTSGSPRAVAFKTISLGADIFMCTKRQPSCPIAHRWLPKIVMLIVFALSATGCNLLKNTLELPEKSLRSMLSLNQGNDAPDPVELQSQLLRFADNYIDAINLASWGLQRSDGQPAERRTLLRRRIAITNDVLGIATAANTYANLLDMVILVSLNRMSVADFWLPQRYGESAKSLLLASQEAEKEIWRIAASALKPEQIKELRTAIQTWHDQHPDVRSPRDIGALGFASDVARDEP